MHTEYDDILGRIPEPPVWFDENAVPRWCEFAPNKVANIYSREVVLALIECQFCRAPFNVAFSSVGPTKQGDRPDHLAGLIETQNLDFGDPPNTRCCAAGPSASSIPIRVLEYWVQPVLLGEGLVENDAGPRIVRDTSALRFRRDPSREVALRPPWES